MYLFLESKDVLSLDRVVAIIKNEGGSSIYLKDGTLLRSVFRPETLAKRNLLNKGKYSLRERG